MRAGDTIGGVDQASIAQDSDSLPRHLHSEAEMPLDGHIHGSSGLADGARGRGTHGWRERNRTPHALRQARCAHNAHGVV